MSSSAIDELICLSSIFGACRFRSQGAGGNISVKEGNVLYIKASGFKITSISKTNGFVGCDILSIKDSLQNSSEDLQRSIIQNHHLKPSMEALFHVLPKKYIVHIHPVFFCRYLCSKNATQLFSTTNFPNSLFVEYAKPGLELAQIILPRYKNESIIFLKNHGIILLSDSIDEIVNLYSTSVHSLENLVSECDQGSDIMIEYSINKSTGLVAKPAYSLYHVLPSSFLAITPDHYLFLDKAPLLSKNETIREDISDYYKVYKKYPCVLQVNNQIYCLGKNIEQCQNKEEYLLSYMDIMKSSHEMNEITEEQQMALLNSSSEKYRLNTL